MFVNKDAPALVVFQQEQFLVYPFLQISSISVTEHYNLLCHLMWEKAVRNRGVS